jgi:RNA polymerase sigma factor (sigma-70 family)
VREGDETAFTELYARHHAVARRVASTYRCGTDADDLVNEAFEKVLGALRRGHGPTDAFRAYLFVTLRRLAAESAERPVDDPLDDVPDPVLAVAGADPLATEDRQMIVTAFGSLPERWQTVLWHTAVEGRKPGDLADSLGMSPNAVSALAYRAREQLRQAYLQAHLRVSPRPQCEPHRSLLGAYVRDGLSRRERTATENHIEHCSSCHVLVGELNEVNQLLVRAIVPLFLAVPGQGAAAAAAAATAGATAAARIGEAGARAAGAAAAGGAGGADPSAVHGLLSVLPWAKEAVSTAGGLAAAALVIAGLTAGTLVLRRDPGHLPMPDTAAEETASTVSTTAPRLLPAEPTGSGAPCAVLASAGSDAGAAPTIDGAGSAGNADTGDDPAPSPTASPAALPESTSSAEMSSHGVPDAPDSSTSPGSGSDADAPLSLGSLLGALLGSDAAADADVPDDADTPVPSSSTSARLTDPSCISHEGRGQLTVGVVNAAGSAGATTTAPADPTTSTSGEPEVAVEAEVLDAVTLEVQLDDGTTALDLNLPPECEVDEADRSVVSCLVGDLLPGTSASATLDLGLDGDGGGATVTVKSGGTTLDVQGLDLLPAVADLTGPVTAGR